MADASDSKSDVGDYVWVQVPSPARYKDEPNLVPMGAGFGFLVYFCNSSAMRRFKAKKALKTCFHKYFSL